ncbi:TMV resistance protein N-like [Eucalyptus grandis]|uniref:TMV resistance protein N-like n=1 Tax=Eucalyptus grandis TaxID=71139 RepID=UPI00192E9E08|nr:TMV resistance protein N-like [Eucalyptus grandis]
MESRTAMLSSLQNASWECDDSRHGPDAASRKRRRTTGSPVSSSSPSSDFAGNNYEVFLSFRGPDTRKGFIDFLYKSLNDVGIHVFRDDDELPVGEEITPALIAAIKQSEVLIPIISGDYASSKSCLMELVQILECKQTMSREIIPIFYEISPSDLKDQGHPFEESFSKHKRNGVDNKTIEDWRLALKEIGTLKGFETAKIHDGHQSEVMDKLIPVVQQKLKKGRLIVTENLVGVDHHVQEIMRKLGVVHHNGQVIKICESDVRVLGIYGIGGVGKTTLANVVYNQLCYYFQGYSHLREIPKKHQHDRILSLQNQLISNLRNRNVTLQCSNDAMTVLDKAFRRKRVLILLDNVEDDGQLDAVIGDLNCFGSGSRIIVTSRNNSILSRFEKAETYEVKPMEEEKALQLFSKRAFGRDFPDKGFESLSMDIIKALGQLPLALEMIGSYLFKKTKGVWKETLKKLKEAPHREVEHVLKISYDALDEDAKQIFLDIACFLIGKNKRIAFYMWEDCELYPHRGIDALRVLSLVKIGQNKELLMDDLLRTLGRSIVSNEDPIPHNRSRLWMHNQALSTLQRKKDPMTVSHLKNLARYRN